MRVRRKFLPRRFNEMCCFAFVMIGTPVVFFFELLVVLPEMHNSDTYAYWLHTLAASWLLFNIVGNFLQSVMVDTSVDLSQLRKPVSSESLSYCDKCQNWAPTRSWHCDKCQCCILKRDHHCLFTGCCIGHNNHRYFLLFLVYMAIGTTYALIYNCIYFGVSKADIYMNWLTPLKLLCPFLMFMIGNTWANAYLIAFSLNIVGLLYTGVLLSCQGEAVLMGGTAYEQSKATGYVYNRGWRKNLECVFGQRMIRAFISPFSSSPLACDGLTCAKNTKLAKRKKLGGVKKAT